MATDRGTRLLCTLDGAATSRVLNLSHIARTNANDPEHSARPLFLSPVINTAFLLKHRIRANESYLFDSPHATGTKVIVPFDLSDLGAGGRSFFVDERGFLENLRGAGHYTDARLERDVHVLRLLRAIPSFDPFLLREDLRNHEIEVAPCYFVISAGDQERMHQFVSSELSQLVQLAGGDDGSTGRMVTAMLSGQASEKLEPLRATLDLSGPDFREGAFGWRGFLYYKWAMQSFWPQVIETLREIKAILPKGPIGAAQHAALTASKRTIIELVRDNSRDINKVLDIYDASFIGLIADSAPKTFREFLLSAPCMFLELGEKFGAISHIVSFWRYRFPQGQPALADVEELSAIFQDFTHGFGERLQEMPSSIPRPAVIEA